MNRGGGTGGYIAFVVITAPIFTLLCCYPSAHGMPFWQLSLSVGAICYYLHPRFRLLFKQHNTSRKLNNNTLTFTIKEADASFSKDHHLAARIQNNLDYSRKPG